MPKMNLGLNGADQGAAQGYEAWPEDKLPPTGSYNGVLKVCQMTKTGPNAKNPDAHMIKVGVEINDPGQDWHGYVAFRNLVIIDKTIPYVNQFLLALTDGSDAAFDKIKKAFWDNGPIVDERQVNVLKIGTYKVDSPEGKLPIKVSVKRGGYYQGQAPNQTWVANSNIDSFLVNEGGGSGGGSSAPVVVAAEEDEDDDGVVTDESGSIFDEDAEEAVTT